MGGAPAALARGGGGGGMDDPTGGGKEAGAAGKVPLPAVAVTSLCEIKFNRKDVKEMNRLMYICHTASGGGDLMPHSQRRRGPRYWRLLHITL